MFIELTKRQAAIVELVKHRGPITSEQIAETLSVAKATLRPDLSVLTMAGFLQARPRVGYYYSGVPMHSELMTVLGSLRVQDYKSVPVVLSDKSTVYDAIVTMFMEDVGTIIIARDGLLQGVVSRKDLLKVAISGGELQKIPVNLAMTRIPHVISIELEASLFQAASLMVLHEIDSLPVVRSSEVGLEVLGRVSKTTITRAFVELGQGPRAIARGSQTLELEDE
ncbi:MAG: helix-turn-helix transcriptional regulator [Alicyclobacillaceae bacterium]|jgi:CBS domain-containing protein|uniref:helix-turn-helix transcriptional regulator n=1 Tax=Alicyclobacillus sp. SP_1 TaxID=2942475 RepID=UPI00215706D3|nr:helix-turn-helix transcriptional regulator [Alicyclobacillus sp. SP_1]MCY0888477.1 helix-turn-helix transcriptional regulator [Alicyclobacillaceae bacterium]MCY0895181.1 helix-turn-helix transcriptional regulator [Alicyclobacillaceae bacterium]